jgi:hypothetical protein
MIILCWINFVILNVFYLKASVVVVGLGLAAAGFAGRQILRVAPQVAQKMSEVLKTMSSESGILVKLQNIMTLLLLL